MAWPTPTLIATSPETIALKGLTFCCILFTLGCVCKSIGTFISKTFRALVDVHSFKVHLCDSYTSVDRILNVTELSSQWDFRKKTLIWCKNSQT